MSTVWVPKREEREKESERIDFKVMTEKFPNLMKYMNLQVQEAQQTPSRINLKRPTIGNTIIKLSKTKDNERIASHGGSHV